jgi:hypothetical protein
VGDIGTRTKVPLRVVIYLSKVSEIDERKCVIYHSKVPKIATKNFFLPSYRFIVGHNILGNSLYSRRAHNIDFMGITKDTEF